MVATPAGRRLSVWLDAIHDKIKDEERYVNKAVYTILGLNVDGHKQLLGLYCFRKRGRKLLAERADGLAQPWCAGYPDCLRGRLKRFPEAIAAVFPDTEVQLCVIHQIRNSMCDIASRDQKAFMRDLKPIYRAVKRRCRNCA